MAKLSAIHQGPPDRKVKRKRAGQRSTTAFEPTCDCRNTASLGTARASQTMATKDKAESAHHHADHPSAPITQGAHSKARAVPQGL
jgi:hypothetical protein